jgi:hypothetical protein
MTNITTNEELRDLGTVHGKEGNFAVLMVNQEVQFVQI